MTGIKLIRKLKSRKGESLAEVLVAVLIVALSAAAFLSMVTASAGINRTTERKDTEFYKTMSKLEAGTADTTGTSETSETSETSDTTETTADKTAPVNGTDAFVTISFSDGTSYTQAVTLLKGTGGMSAYRMKETEAETAAP